MYRNDIEITGFHDLSTGMGIGGWNMVYCAHHKPTGCSVTWTTSGGSYPINAHKMRERALMALELMVEVYG